MKVYEVHSHVCTGPKDLPIIARNLGRLTGSAAAYVSRARSKLSAFAEEAEVTQARHVPAAVLVFRLHLAIAPFCGY